MCGKSAADGSGRVNLTAGSDTNNGMPAFSPDAKRIVFRSARTGNFDLYLMDADGSNLIQLTNDEAKDNFPVFAPSGDAIVFSSDRDSKPDALGFKSFDNYIVKLNPDGTPGELCPYHGRPRTRRPSEFLPGWQMDCLHLGVGPV